MNSQDEVNEIVTVLRNAVASALDEKQSGKVSIEIKELTKMGNVFSVLANFKLAPFLGGRIGKVSVIMAKSDKGYEISSLKIDEKSL